MSCPLRSEEMDEINHNSSGFASMSVQLASNRHSASFCDLVFTKIIFQESVPSPGKRDFSPSDSFYTGTNDIEYPAITLCIYNSNPNSKNLLKNFKILLLFLLTPTWYFIKEEYKHLCKPGSFISFQHSWRKPFRKCFMFRV